MAWMISVGRRAAAIIALNVLWLVAVSERILKRREMREENFF
jgi:hypothetical protein